MAPSFTTSRSALAMLLTLFTLVLTCTGLTNHARKQLVTWFSPRVVACQAERAPARIVQIQRENPARIQEFNVYTKRHGFGKARRKIRIERDGSRKETVIMVDPIIR